MIVILSQLLTAALGLTAESGEFTEISKEDYTYKVNHTMKIMSFI